MQRRLLVYRGDAHQASDRQAVERSREKLRRRRRAPEHAIIASDAEARAVRATRRNLEAAGLGEKAILHSWTGGPKWTKRFAGLGVTFSFAGMVTYPTADTLRLAVAVAPPDRCMVETDTPYLSPQQHRDKPNEPAFVRITGAAVAEVWDIEVAETARLTTATASRVFGFGGE